MKIADVYLAKINLCVDTKLTDFRGTNLLDLTYIKHVESIKESVRLVILKKRKYNKSYFKDLKTHKKYKFGPKEAEIGDKFVSDILPIQKIINSNKDNMPKRKILKITNNLDVKNGGKNEKSI